MACSFTRSTLPPPASTSWTGTSTRSLRPLPSSGLASTSRQMSTRRLSRGAGSTPPPRATSTTCSCRCGAGACSSSQSLQSSAQFPTPDLRPSWAGSTRSCLSCAGTLRSS
ncbi:hypothetical protein T492DRAFT_938807 [Pavlovales sp. CCMP2436]|nr:hypothetical protein T492DRAFT_938807 [Pavlovales sp. CCMP2436]